MKTFARLLFVGTMLLARCAWAADVRRELQHEDENRPAPDESRDPQDHSASENRAYAVLPRNAGARVSAAHLEDRSRFRPGDRREPFFRERPPARRRRCRIADRITERCARRRTGSGDCIDRALSIADGK